jgi:transcriptional regulator with XRE-family HTH domain
MTRALTNPYSLDEIAKRLILLRKALGNTQATMGALAGVSGNAWQNYEKGIRRIELDNVFQLETATGAPQEWIYRGIMARMPIELAEKLHLAKRELEREARKRG